MLFPEDDGPEAREGTAAHYWVTEYLLGRDWPVGSLAPNGHPLDAKMRENGQLYIDDINEELPSFDATASFRVETKVTAHYLIHPECEGTPDTYLLSLLRKRLILWDYKYGHKYIDPYQYPQFIVYIAGIFEAYSLTLADVADLQISVRVVQPRNYHRDGQVRTWNTTGAQIWPLIQHLSRMAYLAKSYNAPTQTGAWCRDCDARHACDAFMRVSAACLDVAGESTPHELTDRALGLELQRIRTALSRLEARKDGLEAMALAAITAGRDVPYWTKGFVNSKERWKLPAPAVLALGQVMGVTMAKPSEDANTICVTPNQARKLGIDPLIIAEYAEKPHGAAKLIPVDETTAAKAFGQQ